MSNKFKIQVGELFADRIRWPANSFEIRYSNGTFIIQVCLPSPSEEELGYFGSGGINIALYCEKNIIFFCFKIEGVMDWSDQAFQIRLLPEDDQGVEECGNFYVPLNWVLVDSETGIVRGLRVTTMSPRFANLFKRELVKQKEASFSRDIHFSTIEKIYEKHRDSKSLVKSSLIQEKAGLTIK